MSIQDNWLVSTYRPKDSEFSATDITSPNAQLWCKINSPKVDNSTAKVGFKSYLGSALHKAVEEVDEDGVIKELSWIRTLPSGIKVGGTTDELRWVGTKWRLGR